VHDTAGVAATEAVRAKVAAVAALAVDLSLTIGGGGGIEPLVADAAGEAVLVPLSAGAHDLLGMVDRLAASRALGSSAKLGRHFVFLCVGGVVLELKCELGQERRLSLR
jgi:hypothetical protein